MLTANDDERLDPCPPRLLSSKRAESRAGTMADSSSSTFASFAHLISPLLLRALADMGFARPTLVQQKAIPLALENRDVLARARTGSGKTAAYCVPLVQKVLNAKTVGGAFNYMDCSKTVF